MKKKVNFQTVDFDYPKKAWMIAACFIVEQDKNMPFFLNNIQAKISGAIKYAKAVYADADRIDDPIQHQDFAIFVPLTLSRLHPLKKEFWDHPTYDMPTMDRNMMFMKASVKPALYDLVVTPYPDDSENKFGPYSATFVFYRGADENLETYMRASTHPVAPEAKNAAIYEIGEPFAYDLVKNKRIKKQEVLQN